MEHDVAQPHPSPDGNSRCNCGGCLELRSRLARPLCPARNAPLRPVSLRLRSLLHSNGQLRRLRAEGPPLPPVQRESSRLRRPLGRRGNLPTDALLYILISLLALGVLLQGAKKGQFFVGL